MASCAACLQPIMRGQLFSLDGTEVFHRSCIGSSYRSKLRLAEQRGLDLERQLNDTRRAAARVEAEANRLRNEATSVRAQVAVLEGRVAGLQAQRELDAESILSRSNELRAARVEIASLRSELASLRPQEDRDSEGDLDATAQRFKMLELD
jgi:chromosome segregation ATPase